jgi:hypothetical protein
MGFKCQFDAKWRLGRPPVNGKGGVEIVDSAASTCRSGCGQLHEKVSTGSEHTDGSACKSTSAKRDCTKDYEESK